MLRITALRNTVVVTMALALTALAADSNVDLKTSKITVTFKQEGVPVDAEFTRFSGRISYDPKNVAASSAVLEVETGSFDIGDPEYNAEVRKKEWFDSAAFPKATFRSTAIKAGTAGKFDATGALHLKGKVVTITVPVSVQAVAGGSAFDGSFTISRKAFGIGAAMWDSVLDDKVSIRFHLVSR